MRQIIRSTLLPLVSRPGSNCTDAGAALTLLLKGGRWQSARRLWPNTWRLQLLLDDCCRLVPPYHVVQHATDRTHPCDPPRMEAKRTTTSNHPSIPYNQMCGARNAGPCAELTSIHWSQPYLDEAAISVIA